MMNKSMTFGELIEKMNERISEITNTLDSEVPKRDQAFLDFEYAQDVYYENPSDSFRKAMTDADDRYYELDTKCEKLSDELYDLQSAIRRIESAFETTNLRTFVAVFASY
jgi:predicted  nucleic acid-binding Zn-ribbon protein